MRTLITLILAILCSTSIAFAEVLSGSQSDYCTWTLDTETGVITISGSGAMQDGNRPWDTYKSYVTSLIIEDEVTYVGAYVFYSYSNLASVTIGSGVTTIGEYAFYECTSLTSITIPDNVTSIGDWSFRWCTGLTSVTIGSGVTYIGEYSFEFCSSLTSITIPDNVTTIGEFAFAYCSILESVTIGSGVTSIGDYAFNTYSTSITSVTCLATTPPSCGSWVFSSDTYVYTTATLYVTSTDYTTADVWKNFENIVLISESGNSTGISVNEKLNSAICSVDNAIVINTETAQTAQVYSLSGQLIVKQAIAAGETTIGIPTGGVYIVVLDEGTKAKVSVK